MAGSEQFLKENSSIFLVPFDNLGIKIQVHEKWKCTFKKLTATLCFFYYIKDQGGFKSSMSTLLRFQNMRNCVDNKVEIFLGP